MEATGIIHTTMHFDPQGGVEQITYRWEGNSLARISWHLLDDMRSDSVKKIKGDELIQIGPYRLKKLEEEPWAGRSIYFRQDYPFWRVAVFWHRFGRTADLAYRRLIITLAVWGLAEYNQAAIPHWRDVNVLRKMASLNLINRLLQRLTKRKVMDWRSLLP